MGSCTSGMTDQLKQCTALWTTTMAAAVKEVTGMENPAVILRTPARQQEVVVESKPAVADFLAGGCQVAGSQVTCCQVAGCQETGSQVVGFLVAGHPTIRFLVAGCPEEGYLVAGYLVAGYFAAGRLVTACLAANVPLPALALAGAEALDSVASP